MCVCLFFVFSVCCCCSGIACVGFLPFLIQFGIAVVKQSMARLFRSSSRLALSYFGVIQIFSSDV